MSDTNPGIALIDELDRRCERVKLTRVDTNQADLVSGARIWTGSYAAVLLWPALAKDVQTLESAAKAGEAWLAEFLLSVETARSARVIDGYLLLLLAAKPSEDLLEQVRELELSFRVCRKHVIWPLDSDTTQRPRLDAVTVLALPDGVTAASGEVRWPELEPSESELWDRIHSTGGAATAQAEGALP